MSFTGNLKLTIVKAEGVPKLEKNGEKKLTGYDSAVRITIDNVAERKTTSFKGLGHTPNEYNDALEFRLNNVKDAARIKFEVINRDEQVQVEAFEPLRKFLADDTKNYVVQLTKKTSVMLTADWSPVKASSSDDAGKKKKMFVSPSTTLKTTDEHRSQYLRVAYYYDASKKIYEYTKGFKGISLVAQYGERSVDYVLAKVGLKSMESVDNSLKPVLSKVDESIDKNIYAAIHALVRAQEKVLRKKNEAVSKISDATSATYQSASNVAHAAGNKVSNAASATRSGVSNAAHSTKETVSHVAHATIAQVSHAKDVTVNTVSNVSNSAYKTVSGVATYLVSYVPIVGQRYYSSATH